LRIIRTLLFAAFGLLALIFVGMNWRERVPVRIWPFDDGLLFEWPVGFIAPVFFLLGLLPMWFYHRGVKWSLSRKVVSLENAARAALAPKPAPPAEPETGAHKPESEA
jgi:lipopolysaccharide assembly protein A